MKNRLTILLLGVFIVGCAHSDRDIAATETISRPKPEAGLLMTGEPSETVTDVWRVRVLPDALQIASLIAGIHSSPAGWKPGRGWFVFIENRQNVWAYDGDRSLLLLEHKKDGDHTTHTWSGPTRFSTAVPQEVLGRLSERTRNAIVTRE